MDDMQRRIAARRAELERQRQGKVGDVEPDMSGIFDGLFGSDGADAGQPAKPAPQSSYSHRDTAEPAGVQDRIAARRVEVERDRARADAAAKAEKAGRDAESKAASDRQRKLREQALLRDAAPATKKAADQLLTTAAHRRWTGGEWGVVGIVAAFGLWIFSSYPIVGTIALLVAVGMYWGHTSTHRDNLRKEYPHLFGPPSD